MQSFKDRFATLRAAGNLDAALVRWRKDECSPLKKFVHLDELVELLEIPEEELKQDKDVVLRALCELARGGDEEASLLLIWLFLGVFRKTQGEIGLCRLSEEELEAEMLAGFWEEVSRDHDAEENVAARLFYSVHNRAWKAIRWANRGGSPDPDVGSDFDARGLRGQLPDPIWLIERAKNEGVLSQGQADLILANRVQGRRIEDLADEAGISRQAMGMRRTRAEQKFLAWLGESEEIEALSVAHPVANSTPTYHQTQARARTDVA